MQIIPLLSIIDGILLLIIKLLKLLNVTIFHNITLILIKKEKQVGLMSIRGLFWKHLKIQTFDH